MPAIGPNRPAGAVGIKLLIALMVTLIVAIAVWTGICPCERIPGGYLLGEEIDEPVSDWSFANAVPLCQIEVRAAGLPHSINLNCMAADGALYLSCASCEGKYWSTAVLERPAARLRIADRVYPVIVTRVIEPAILDTAWRARADKVGRGADQPRQEGWWSFRVVSRGD